MTRSRPSARPYARPSASLASRLAEAAGNAPTLFDAGARVERLEPRQMLFTLTIAPDAFNPGATIGSATAVFGYTIPLFATNVEIDDDVDPEVREEDFGDNGVGLVPPVAEFDDSFFVIRHNIQPAFDTQIVADFDADGEVIDGTERLRLRLGAGENITFELDSGDTLNSGQDLNLPINVFSFTVDRAAVGGGNLGLPINDITIILTLRGQEVGRIAGAQIIDRFVGGAGDPNAQQGVGQVVLDAQNDDLISSPFDQVRIVSSGPTSAFFEMDNFQATLPAGIFAPVVQSRVFGAEITITGPIGASVQVFDAYGRSMVPTLALGTPEDAGQFVLVDLNDDGIPDFNDGIGRIVLRNVDAQTTLTIAGGTVETGADDAFPDGVFQDGIFEEGDFRYTRAEEIRGLYDEFEAAGFGYAFSVIDGETEVTGLPPGPGSVIIGSPLVPPQDNYDPLGSGRQFGFFGLTDVSLFNRVDQGIFVDDGSAMGEIIVHGVLHGTSSFDSTLDLLNVGYMVGSLSVSGDLGKFIVGTDAGLWQVDPEFQQDPNAPDFEPTVTTGSQLFVGRSVNEVFIGGRSLMEIQVDGDISDPINRPARDTLRYTELEYVVPVDEGAEFDEQGYLNAVLNRGGQFNPVFVGLSNLRNDTVLNAEFVGSLATAVEITGSVGFGNPGSDSNEDPGDVYAFPVTGDQPVTVQFQTTAALSGLLVRIVDQDGRTLAGNTALDFTARSDTLVFNPERPGVYYLVVQSLGDVDGDTDNGVTYQLALNGLAPVALGGFRTGGGAGGILQDAASQNISVATGSAGLIRIGTGLRSGEGDDVSPLDYINSTSPSVDDALEFGAGVFNIDGSLYTFVSGGDIEPAGTAGGGGATADSVVMLIGGDLGGFYVGLAEIIGLSPAQGDVGEVSLQVGGGIGEIDIRGAIGIDQDVAALQRISGGPFTIQTGLDGNSRGDIGYFRVGSHLASNTLRIETPDGGVIGAFLISQDTFDAPSGNGAYGISQLGNAIFNDRLISTGFGGDVRFVDIPRIDLASINAGFAINVGTGVEIIDDAGGKVTITITGVGLGANAGFIRVLPVEGSQGVAIATIEANLSGGRTLNILSEGQPGESDPISIGRIRITDGTAVSALSIQGTLPVDIYRIEQTGGEAFGTITQATPGGDIVAIDVNTLNTLTIDDGNLGITEMPAIGRNLIGPELGITPGGGGVGEELGILAAAMDETWNGLVHRPTDDGVIGATGYLSDIGGPMDTYLNGLVVREGNLTLAEVAGAVADLIVQTGRLVDLTVDSDGVTRFGGFDGIVGTIYANDIDRVEIGDGLAPRATSPIATTGIFANDDIVLIEGGTKPGASIESVIIAANVAIDPLVDFDGIQTINLTTGGDFVNAYIGTTQLDAFALSIDFADDRTFTGDIQNVNGDGADFFLSNLQTLNLGTFALIDGFFDASSLSAFTTAQSISATGYRNSTITGTDLEFQPASILIGGNVNEITTELPTGDYSDILIDVLGRVEQGIDGDTFTRVNLQVDGEIESLDIAGSFLAGQINTGALVSLTIGDRLASSLVRVSGPIDFFDVGGSIINADIGVTGPNGRIEDIDVAGEISGSIIRVTGPIGSIITGTGNLDARIVTEGPRGNVGLLRAARDLVIDTDISGGVAGLIAGRNIGRQGEPNVVLVRGDLVSVSVPNGQLYSDIRVGGTIGVNQVQVGAGTGGTGGGATGITIGRASNLAGNNTLGTGSIVAFDRIGNVTINGDFAGTIESNSNGLASVTINNGSLTQDGAIRVRNGSLENLRITNGHLLGDVFADIDIRSLVVNGSASATFGNVGIDPSLSPLTAAGDGFRNQLPLGASISPQLDGPSIFAGRDIVAFTVTGGSIYEAAIHAGRDILAMSVTGGILADNESQEFATANAITAGRTITSLSAGGAVENTLIGAGFFDLGSDLRPLGGGLAADTIVAGTIGSISIGGNASDITVVAGATPGADGIYGNNNDRQALGRSSIGGLSIGGSESNVVAIGENLSGIDGRVQVRTNLQSADNLLVDGAISGGARGSGSTFNNGNGEVGTITILGPGQAFWSAADSTLTITGTTSATSITLTSANGRFTDINILSTNDASVGTLAIQADLFGESNIVIDNAATTLSLRNVDIDGRISFGGTVGTLTANNILGGFINLGTLTTGTIANDFGATNENIRGEASLSVLSAGTITIGGDLRALINIERSATRIAVTGDIDNANIRVGGNLGTATTTATSAGGAGTVSAGAAALSAGRVLESRISVNDQLGPVFVGDDFFDSALLIGGDLGSDGEIGGVGINADEATVGFGSNISILGGFAQSDIVAGALRGPDGFFGTSDDSFGPGRARIGNVTIGQNELGSNRFTESYRITSSGILGTVRVAGQQVTSINNFAVVDADPLPVALVVEDLRVERISQFYTATMTFNLPIDYSSLGQALSVREVRGSSGQIEIFLTEGLDYTLIPQPASNSVQIRFSRDITSRDLPQLAGVPGPGVYRFVLDPTAIRSQVAGARLDGNNDGFASGADDFFSEDDIVGDAGDRTANTVANATLQTPSGQTQQFRVDFYGPVNLDVVLDDNINSDGIPDANRTFTLRGVLGDHPDHNINFFRSAGDLDLYRITLQEGQILRLGDVSGSAPGIVRTLFSPSGEPLVVGETNAILSLPAPTPDVNDLSTPLNYLIRETGQYLLAVSSGNVDVVTAINPGAPIPDPGPAALAQGAYRFDIQIFDDGDSGFSGNTDASNGADIVEAPTPGEFPGNRTTLTIGGSTFTLDVGPDGQRNTADDVVTGGNGLGVTSEFRNGVVTTRVDSAIGTPDVPGLPNEVFPDVDVFHIDGRNLIEPGVKYRVTVELTQLGSDLGSRGVDRGVDSEFSFENFSGFVQFGIFDTTGSASIDDADLVLAPTDFSPNGGTPGVLAQNGDVSYGYDANGNFFVEFVTLGRLGTESDAASYAIYLQGAFNADYNLQIQRLGEGTFNARGQNFFLETLGGEVDWLFASGRVAQLAGFDPGVLGLVGSVADGRSIEEFLLQELVAGLDAIFADYDINFSTNPDDFEFQDFSTIFLSASNDPISVIFDAFTFQQFGDLGFLTQPFGFAEHSDALNTDTEDEAVVFLPSLATLGYTPSQTDIEDLVDSLTAVVAQQAGELLGLRVTAPGGEADIVAVMSSNSASNVPNGPNERYGISTIDRALSGAFDNNDFDNFWLGQQNSASLLDKILGN